MEEQNKNQFIAVAYQLYAAGDKTLEFIEEATDERPFEFISGFGLTLPDFERQLSGLSKGDEFQFTLNREQAYGNREEERVVDLEREIFCVNGHFDHDNVFVDAVLPLQNEDGQYFQGKVLSIGDTHVKIDLNHPLAGRDLNFKGHIVEKREATNEEIQNLLNQLEGGGCGCGCGDCDSDCHHDHHHHDGCHCSHCH